MNQNLGKPPAPKVTIAGAATVNEKPKPPGRKVKPPIPRYRYKLATVSCSQQACLMEKALRERLGRLGLSYFTIGHEGGSCDVMDDSGTTAMDDSELRNARAVAAQIKKAG
jgi:hypothetical protein